MSPEDPRHGQYAGWQAHRKAGTQPCDPCRRAQARYFKAMKYRLLTSGPERGPLGAEAWTVIDRMGRRELSRLTGLRDSYLSRIHGRGPEVMVYRRTRDRILAVGTPATPVGIHRRLRALFALGYSGAYLAREVGVSNDAMRRVIRSDVPRKYHHPRVTAAVVDLYDRLHVAPMPSGSAAVAARNRARAKGYVPPLAWDEGTIDDPTAKPYTGRDSQLYRSDELAAEWDFLRRAGVSIHAAAQQLGVSVSAIEKALERVGKDVA